MNTGVFRLSIAGRSILGRPAVWPPVNPVTVPERHV